MADFLKSVDTWFLIMAVVLLGGFFLWAVKYLFDGIRSSVDKLALSFDKSIDKLEMLIKELFHGRNDHEARIIAVETKCNFMHGEYENQRVSGGRRPYDPVKPIQTINDEP